MDLNKVISFFQKNNPIVFMIMLTHSSERIFNTMRYTGITCTIYYLVTKNQLFLGLLRKFNQDRNERRLKASLKNKKTADA